MNGLYVYIVLATALFMSIYFLHTHEKEYHDNKITLDGFKRMMANRAKPVRKV